VTYDRIERQYGKARRTWVMDRGIPTEAVLEVMRQAEANGRRRRPLTQNPDQQGFTFQ
jgi:hypothetical protein